MGALVRDDTEELGRGNLVSPVHYVKYFSFYIKTL